MLDKDNKDTKQVRRAIEIVNRAFGAWEKCPVPKALILKDVYIIFSITKGNNHYHIYFENSKIFRK